MFFWQQLRCNLACNLACNPLWSAFVAKENAEAPENPTTSPINGLPMVDLVFLCVQIADGDGNRGRKEGKFQVESCWVLPNLHRSHL